MPLGIGILVFIIDQLVKHLVVSTMHLGQSLPVIKGIFHITYVLNPGAAFGMLEHQRWFFILVALAAVLLGAAFYKKLQQESFLMRSGAGLLLGGAVGNLAPRIQRGRVVDFSHIRNWPLVNIADNANCAGPGILIFDIWQRRNEDEICS